MATESANPTQHELWLYGRGGYYKLLVNEESVATIPLDYEGLRVFNAYAPLELVALAQVATEEVRNRKRMELARAVLRRMWKAAAIAPKGE